MTTAQIRSEIKRTIGAETPTRVLIDGDTYGVYPTREEAERVAEALRGVWWIRKTTITTQAV